MAEVFRRSRSDSVVLCDAGGRYRDRCYFLWCLHYPSLPDPRKWVAQNGKFLICRVVDDLCVGVFCYSVMFSMDTSSAAFCALQNRGGLKGDPKAAVGVSRKHCISVMLYSTRESDERSRQERTPTPQPTTRPNFDEDRFTPQSIGTVQVCHALDRRLAGTEQRTLDTHAKRYTSTNRQCRTIPCKRYTNTNRQCRAIPCTKILRRLRLLGPPFSKAFGKTKWDTWRSPL